LRGAPGITAGPDGNVWFTEFTTSQIGQITPDGSVSEFPLPDRTFPREITAGPDGNLWYTASGGVRQFIIAGGPEGPTSPAAVASLFAGAARESLKPVVDRQLTAAHVDAVFTSAMPELTAQAERLAAVDAGFPGAHAGAGESVVSRPQAPVAANAGAFSTRDLEALTPPPAQPAVIDADTLPHQRKQDSAEAADTAGLTDLLTADGTTAWLESGV
jgi:hypothetical protein